MEQLSTPELIQVCRAENERYRRGQASEGQHSFELFRRAIVEQDQPAWEAIYQQYWRLMARWVNGPNDQVNDRVQTAYLKFLHAIRPQTFDGKFATIGHLMAFLKRCAYAVKIDDARLNARQERYGPPIAWDELPASKIPQVTEATLEHLARQELLAYIEQTLRDEQERLVIRLSLLGYTPLQIAEKARKTFQNVEEVRKVKERVLLRLSSDARLQSEWQI